MKTKNFGKILLIGLIILFAGASVIPNIGAKNVIIGDQSSIGKTPQPLFTGESYFILLSDYTDGAGQDNTWAVQMRFDSELMIVENEFDAISLPLILDQWTEILVEIDLDSDWMEIYYNGDFLLEKAWTATINNDGSGQLNIAAVDLFANSASTVYYDDLSIELFGTGVIWADDFESYAVGSSMHGQGGWKGWDNNPTWTAYVSDDESHSSTKSVDIKADADLVHEFEGLTSGVYIFIAWIYIPSVVGEPPEAPTIDCPLTGDPGTSYNYIFNSIDPDGDDVKYYIDWGDDQVDETDFLGSGTDKTVPHTYAVSGKYTITAYAEDDNGNIGTSSTFQTTMPKDKTITNPFLNWLQSHPNLFPLMQKLLLQLGFGF